MGSDNCTKMRVEICHESKAPKSMVYCYEKEISLENQQGTQPQIPSMKHPLVSRQPLQASRSMLTPKLFVKFQVLWQTRLVRPPKPKTLQSNQLHSNTIACCQPLPSTFSSTSSRRSERMVHVRLGDRLHRVNSKLSFQTYTGSFPFV